MDLSPKNNYKLPNHSPYALKYDTGTLKPFQPVKRPPWIYLFVWVIGAIFTWVFIRLAIMLGYPVSYGFAAVGVMITFFAAWLHGNFFGSIIDWLFELPDLLGMVLGQRWRELVLALGLFTRLPLPELEDHSPLEVSFVKSLNPAWAYPFVGFLIGCLSALVILLCSFLSIPMILTALLVLPFMLLLTGGLHEDGLSDFIDGIGGGENREDTLRIMKDSRLGSYGGIAMFFSLAARIAAIATLTPMAAAAAVIASHTIARGALVLPLHWYAPAKANGVAVQATNWVSGGIAAFVLISTILLTLIVIPSPHITFFAWLIGILTVILTARYAYKRLGGYTGDVLGAAEQFAEIAVLWTITAFVAKTVA